MLLNDEPQLIGGGLAALSVWPPATGSGVSAKSRFDW
jgi:hypothetical protein